MEPTVVVPLAPGFEEIEAVTIVDVLRRAEVPVTVVGLTPGPVTGAHGLKVDTDATIDQVDAADVRAMVLPGGMPGATNLREDERVLALLRTLHGSDRTVAAICAAPMVLGAAGLLEGVEATCYPGFEEHLTGARHSQQRVVRAGRVLTSRGPGTALEFALALVEELGAPERAAELRAGMLVGD